MHVVIYLDQLFEMCFLLTDINGVVTTKRLDQKQVHSLPANEKVELPYFEETGQPTKDAGVLFHRYCRLLRRDYRRFPIDPLDWRKVPSTQKDEAWENIKVIHISKY